ncbi:MAG: cyclomaltodextrinase C-terminal domain-containing protein, partial [Bacteroidota bacterium]|nr:cyclomaltodextrinase C-terminal domain-containing protein [Bacteroidota bacterium]
QDFLIGTKGLSNIYEVFAKDFVYANPNNLLIFPDNHDHQRGMFAANGNFTKMKCALTMVLTTRGIPQLLYGTELGMKGGREHTELRMDFPGGFPNDKRNAFTADGRTKAENDMFEHVKKLLHLRQEYKAISIGKFTHYPPVNEIYYYTKSLGNEKVLFVINGNKNNVEIDFDQVQHIIEKRILKDIYSNDLDFAFTPGMKITVPGYGFKIYLIK